MDSSAIYSPLLCLLTNLLAHVTMAATALRAEVHEYPFSALFLGLLSHPLDRESEPKRLYVPRLVL